jgi:dipeptidyl aminopeptidase/acylaminoacyl peptidase
MRLAIDSPEVALQLTTASVLAGVDTLIRRRIADPGRLALVGFSAGGGIVNDVVTHTDRFSCAIAQSPATGDWTSNFFLDPDGEYELIFLNGSTPWDHPQTYTALSSVYRVDRIHARMLYAIGDRESILFLVNALEMYDGLRRLRRPVEVLRYPGQGHGFSGRALADFSHRAREFLDHCWR